MVGFRVLLMVAPVLQCAAFSTSFTQTSLLKRQTAVVEPRHRQLQAASCLRMLDAAAANEGLRQAQHAALQQLLDGGLGLKTSGDCVVGDATVRTLVGVDVAWLSTVEAPQLTTLTSWNGPLLCKVPHLRSYVGATEAGIEVSIDFCPRGDAGYDTANDDGSFPEPESRAAFMMKQLRTDYAEAFFTPELEAWVAELRNLPGAEARPLRRSAKVVGPVGLETRLPLTDEGLALAERACLQAAGSYLGWMRAAERGGQTASQQAFAHDCKVRAFMAGFTEQQFSERFGEVLGADLAAADAGPRDLADRGGAMSAAAKDNFEANPLKY